MAQPTFFVDGNAPRRSDTRWRRWVRILGRQQEVAGANSANNPKRTDTLRNLKYKLLKSIRGD